MAVTIEIVAESNGSLREHHVCEFSELFEADSITIVSDKSKKFLENNRKKIFITRKPFN